MNIIKASKASSNFFIIFLIVNIYSDDEGRNGYHSGGGRGSSNFDGQSAADFWDDFNINDPQSVYVDKYSQQEEIGGVGNYHRLNQFKRPSVESSWGQRQVI